MSVKISEFPVAGSAAATDQLEANQSGTSRSITVDQVRAVASPVSGTTATFTTSDATHGLRFAGATTGIRGYAQSTGYTIEATDNTWLGSFQPLTLGGSAVTISAPLSLTGTLTALSATAVGAGANTQAFVKASSTANLGIYYGTGDPTFSAAKGSLYSRTDATTTTTRLWVNTNGSTTWANFTSSA